MKVQSLTVSNPPHPPLQSQKAHYFDWKILNADHLSWDSFEASEELEMFLAKAENRRRKRDPNVGSFGLTSQVNVSHRTSCCGQTPKHCCTWQGKRSRMFIRTNLQWKILGVSNQITCDYKHVLASSCRSEPKTKHRPLLAGIKPQSIPNVVVFPDTKLLMCCAWLLPNMLIAPSNAPLVSARNLPTSVPHLCYTQTSINFVLYKFWWLPAPLWPSNAKISPWYMTFKTPSNLVKGSDSDMSDTDWHAIKIHQKRTECSTKSKLSTARIWPNCFESFEISTVWPFRDLCDFRWRSKSELVNAGCPNIIAAASPMSRSTNAVTCHEVQKISYENLKDMLHVALCCISCNIGIKCCRSHGVKGKTLKSAMFPIFLAILAILVIVLMNQLTSGLVGASSGASGGALPRRSSGPAGPTTSIKLWIQTCT